MKAVPKRPPSKEELKRIKIIKMKFMFKTVLGGICSGILGWYLTELIEKKYFS